MPTARVMWTRMCAAVLLAVAGAAASAQTFGPISVSLRPSPGIANTLCHGSFVLPYAVRNADESPHVVTVEIDFPHGGHYGDRLGSIRRSVKVEAGAGASIKLYVPSMPASYPRARVWIDGSPQPGGLTAPSNAPFAHWRTHHGGAVTQVNVLVAQESVNRDNLHSAFVSTIPRLTTGPTHGGGHPSLNLIRSEIPVPQWDDSWLAYSAFDGIVLTGQAFTRAPAMVRQAVQRYVECGGILVLMGEERALEDLGLDLSDTHPEQTPRQRVRRQGLGFGTLWCIAANEIDRQDDEWSNEVRMDLWNAWRDRSRAQAERHRLNTLHSSFPVVDSIQVPVRGIMLCLLIFAILAGPVNMVILARRNRRIWLLWTAPALSLATCGVVVAYAFLGEGLLAKERTAAITYLDEATRRAVTSAVSGFYFSLPPGGGLEYDLNTQFACLTAYTGGRGTPRGVDQTSGNHLTNGWISARIPAYVHLLRNQERSERLQVAWAGDRLEVLNGLGADIRKLGITGPNGQHFVSTGPIPAGGRQVLTSPGGKLRVVGLSESLSSTISFNALVAATAESAIPDACREPGTYVALLDGAPFLEPAIQRRRMDRTALSVVYGVLAEPPQGEQP